MSFRGLQSSTLIVLVSLALPGAHLRTQEPPVPLGTRVRVSFPRGSLAERPELDRLTGTLMRLPADSIVVYDDAVLDQVAVSRDVIRRLEVSRGRHAHAGRGALIGLAVGVSGGVATGLLLCSGGNCNDDDGPWTALIAGTLGLGGAAAGAGIGALVGALLRHEAWTTVALTAEGAAQPAPGTGSARPPTPEPAPPL